MKTKTKRTGTMLIIAVFLTIALATMPAQAEAEVTTTNENIDMKRYVYIPCTEEWVYLNGTLHVMTHATLNDNGIHIKTHFNPKGISGVGLVTGNTYHATGVTQYNFNINEGVTDTYINNFRIISKGSGENYMVI